MVATAYRCEASEVSYEPRESLSLLRIAEPPPDPISEAELSIIWAEQRYPAGALATPAGQAVEVVFPGRKGGAAGPDFRDAVLRIEGEERRGDVELHVRASYFRSHGHHLDPAYDALALHVVYLADDGADTTLHGGGSTPVAAFAPWVEQRSADLQRWLLGPPLWQEPCCDAVARHGPDAVREVLASAGRERLAARSQRLLDDAVQIGAGEALWRALFDVLGQGGDREGFRRLSRVLTLTLAQTIRRDRGAGLLEGSLLYVAGLAARPEGLETLLPQPLRPALQGGTGRPANRPQRRLAAVAHLLERADNDLSSYVTNSVMAAKDAAALVAAWQIPSLLGPEKASELVLNVVLPLAERAPALAAKASELKRQLPAQRAYGKTEFLEQHLRRPDGKRLVRTALEQQGLLALLGDWCSQGGCGRCALS